MQLPSGGFRTALLLCALAGRCDCAFERQPESVRSCGMGGAGIALPGNPWGALTNPAALSPVSGRVLALSFSPTPFGMQELRRSAFAYVEPWGSFTPSLAGNRYGFELYREVTLGAACGVECGHGVRAGAAFLFNALSIAGYGRGSCVGLDAGVLLEVVPGLNVGASAQNLTAPSPGRSGESVPVMLQVGIAYARPGVLLVACDLAQDPRFPAEVRLGAEVSATEYLSLRAGVSTDPSSYSAGLSVSFSSVIIEYAFTRHQELGFTHRFGLSLCLGGA